MQKIIIDTNVIISALISNGPPSKIIREILFEEKAHLIVSQDIMEEYFEVLNRPKFSEFPDFKANAAIVINLISELGIVFSPNQKLDILKDATDNKFLELALISDADFIITGNTKDFTIEKIENTFIVTPNEFWKNNRQI